MACRSASIFCESVKARLVFSLWFFRLTADFCCCFSAVSKISVRLSQRRGWRLFKTIPNCVFFLPISEGTLGHCLMFLESVQLFQLSIYLSQCFVKAFSHVRKYQNFVLGSSISSEKKLRHRSSLFWHPIKFSTHLKRSARFFSIPRLFQQFSFNHPR